MTKYAPKAMELGPRDIVARGITTEILEGRGFEDSYVYLDLTHLGRAKIMERLPGIREITLDFIGLDPIEKPIPIQPGTHYCMGGIDTNIDGESPLKGFYASACMVQIDWAGIHFWTLWSSEKEPEPKPQNT
jgi:succinate dehydrogenase / fumarate reductase flavoprotein subunit